MLFDFKFAKSANETNNFTLTNQTTDVAVGGGMQISVIEIVVAIWVLSLVAEEIRQVNDACFPLARYLIFEIFQTTKVNDDDLNF
jgi:hypothetical protein